eukprot:3974053-Pleurochrysis_carterae.AAC.1
MSLAPTAHWSSSGRARGGGAVMIGLAGAPSGRSVRTAYSRAQRGWRACALERGKMMPLGVARRGRGGWRRRQ